MSDQNKIRAILANLRHGINNDPDTSNYVELKLFVEAEQAILEFINEVIGEDEPETMDVEGRTVHLIHANQLRAEQRRRAGL